MADPNGPVIEAIRKRLGQRRSELAGRVGCSYQHIYNLERGFNLNVSDELLQRIADVFGVEVGTLTRKQPEPRPAPTSRPVPATPVAPPRPTKPPTRATEGAVA